MTDSQEPEQLPEAYVEMLERLQSRVAANRMAAAQRSERQSLTQRIRRPLET